MPLLTREAILARSTRRRQTEPSAVLGGDVLLQELSRMDYRAAVTAATVPDKPDQINLDLWHAAIFAFGVIDEAGEPLCALDDLITWRSDAALWDEVARIAGRVLALSEVGADALTKSDPPADPGRRDRPRGRQRAERGAAGRAGVADQG